MPLEESRQFILKNAGLLAALLFGVVAHLNADIPILEGIELNFHELEKLATDGDVRAQVILGDRLFLGDRVEANPAAARKWYEQGASIGDTIAQHRLGKTYYVNTEHTPTDDDDKKAAYWLEKASDRGYALAQADLASKYFVGRGVPLNPSQARNLYFKAAIQGHAGAASILGSEFEYFGKNPAEALKWYRQSASLGEPWAQSTLADKYYQGSLVPRDLIEARMWYEKAAVQGDESGQFGLGRMYFRGDGVPVNYIEAYKWISLALSVSDGLNEEHRQQASAAIKSLEAKMSVIQIAEAQAGAKSFEPDWETKWKWQHNIDVAFVAKHYPQSDAGKPSRPRNEEQHRVTGTGFLVTEDGFIVTNQHVVAGAPKLKVRIADQYLEAAIIKVDEYNDLAVVKVNGRFNALPVFGANAVKLGETVFTIGFPNPSLQGIAPKLTKGEISSLSGILDDPRHFQISIPVQPGNSGGALVNSWGNVVGVVSHKLNQREAIKETGSTVENVNYGIKGTLLNTLLESLPDIQAKLQKPVNVEQKFDDAVQSVKRATVLIEAY